MDTQSYYGLIRAQERDITSEYVWIASLQSHNGGISGRIYEVARRTAAKMIVDCTARLATPDEVQDERARLQVRHRRANVLSRTSFIVTSYAEPGQSNG
jgi:hypothetical protein